MQLLPVGVHYWWKLDTFKIKLKQEQNALVNSRTDLMALCLWTVYVKVNCHRSFPEFICTIVTTLEHGHNLTIC